MATALWAQQTVEGFFRRRKYPTQFECNRIARKVSGASDVHNVDTPGSMSYTVVCTGCRGGDGKDLVISFREPEAHLDELMEEMARATHGDLVPATSRCDVMDGADPPLTIYTMPYLRGISCLDALACQVEMDEATEARHVYFVRHLPRCWLKPQQVTAEARAEALDGVRRRLVLLSSSCILGASMMPELERSLPILFGQEYPQVLTHGDLSLTNILVHDDTYEITGIVDWSLAALLPFGMELDCLFLTTGYMDRGGWHDYACCSQLREAFWLEFWSASGIEDSARRNVRNMAEQAARTGATLRYAFRRNANGSPSEVLASEEALAWSYLREWLAA
ncbi:hypothetical protein Daus18300_014236 [Diaporthe australafricana]|uniref:Aminoglycoside phosphotransferase domain-containing protein n=1 Tax=Diaporthe australafricana TaxID=127596 RepID=A0ABR3VW11_9PEZI